MRFVLPFNNNWFREMSGVKILLSVSWGMLLSFLCLPHSAHANVYATNIKLNGTTNNTVMPQGGQLKISYVLNEPASAGVTIDILSDTNLVRSIILTNGDIGTAVGDNVVYWDGTDGNGTNMPPGNYSFRVTAASAGYTNWTQITDDSSTNAYVYDPRGIAVNQNTNSPYYGRVFVSNAADGGDTRPGSLVGILKFNADASPAGEGTFSTGGYPWVGDDFSPWKLEVSADDIVYVNDWSGTNSAGVIIAFDQVISTNYQVVFGSSNWPPVGTDPRTGDTNYANLSGPFITGTGTNTQIWMADISFNANSDVAHSVGVRRWNVSTNGAVAPGDLGTTIVQAGFGSDLNLYPYDIAVDRSNQVYTIQDRLNPADTANKAFRFPAYDESGNPELTADWKVGGANALVGAVGLAVDPTASFVSVALRAFGGLPGSVAVLDATTGTNVVTIGGPNSDYRDVGWDAVGNLYAVDNFNLVWQAFSPPGTNQATTVALETVRLMMPPLLSEVAKADNQLQFLLTGEPNVSYVIQASTNLVDWSAVSTNLSTNTTQTIAVDASPDQSFYRAVVGP